MGFRVPGGENSIPDYGSEAHASERQRATAELAGYLEARVADEWSRACTYLAAALRDQLEKYAGTKTNGKDCAPILAALFNKTAQDGHQPPANTLTTAGIAALRINGDNAFALYHGPNNTKYVMPMINEHGTWKMTQTTPLPYPLTTPTNNP